MLPKELIMLGLSSLNSAMVNKIWMSRHCNCIFENVYCNAWGEEGMLQVSNKEFILTNRFAVMENQPWNKQTKNDQNTPFFVKTKREALLLIFLERSHVIFKSLNIWIHLRSCVIYKFITWKGKILIDIATKLIFLIKSWRRIDSNKIITLNLREIRLPLMQLVILLLRVFKW